MLNQNILRHLFLPIALILFVEGMAQTETQNITFPFWKIRGNSGTDTSINFVGTTDAVDLTLRTNNVRRVTITKNGFVGIGTIVPTRMLELSGLANGVRIGGLSTGGSFITTPSATTDKILFADANGDVRAMTAGTTGYVLTYTASGPAWSAPGGSSGWALTGNASTIAGTNFIGTTDGVDFVIKTNSTEAMRVVNGGQVAVNNSAPTAGNQFSVYSTSANTGIYISSTSTGKGMHNVTSSTADAVLIEKTGATGRGINLFMNTAGNPDVGIAVGQNGTGRAGNFQQQNSSSSSPAVFASTAGTGRAISAQNSSTTSTNAVGFFSQASTGTVVASYQFAPAVWGQSTGIRGGTFQSSMANTNTTVLQGTFSGPAGNDDGIGVAGNYVGNAGYGYGVVGTGNNYGVWAVGNSGASGTKSFRIDHPLDPYNKYLKHYSIESPEVLNVYRGSVILDTKGEAVVTMPDYFDSITTNCTYSLTPIGTQTNVYIKQEIIDRQFVIAGGAPGQKICWFVYGNRNDLYVRSNAQSTEVEVQKREHERGKLLHPELYGQPDNLGMFYNNITKQFMAPDGTIDEVREEKK
jgi:hypothetical protein